MKSRSRKFDESVNPQQVKKIIGYKGKIGEGKTNNQLRLVLWNVNGIRSVLNKLAMRDLIVQYFPDFICINQTKINYELYMKEVIRIEGYFDYWNFCKCSAGYSGVAVFSKFKPISIFQDLEEPEHSQEGRVLTLEYEHFYLVVAYIPSAGDRELKRLQYKLKYEKAFYKHCEQLKKRGKGVIVCGDMNVCHQELDIYLTPYSYKLPGFTPIERNSFNKFLKLGWIDTFRKFNPAAKEFTWWRTQHKNRERGIGRRLDYFLVDQQFLGKVKKSIVLGQVMGSDHCPIYLQINLADKRKEETALETKKESWQMEKTAATTVMRSDPTVDLPFDSQSKIEQIRVSEESPSIVSPVLKKEE